MNISGVCLSRSSPRLINAKTRQSGRSKTVISLRLVSGVLALLGSWIVPREVNAAAFPGNPSATIELSMSSSYDDEPHQDHRKCHLELSGSAEFGMSSTGISLVGITGTGGCEASGVVLVNPYTLPPSDPRHIPHGLKDLGCWSDLLGLPKPSGCENQIKHCSHTFNGPFKVYVDFPPYVYDYRHPTPDDFNGATARAPISIQITPSDVTSSGEGCDINPRLDKLITLLALPPNNSAIRFSCSNHICRPRSGTLVSFHGKPAPLLREGLNLLFYGPLQLSVDVKFLGCEEQIVKVAGVDTASNDGKTSDGDKSFVSTDALTFHATVEPGCDGSKVRWAIESTTANGTLNPNVGEGLVFNASPSPPPAAEGRQDGLEYKVSASIEKSSDKITISQDGIDKIRQQYIDMDKTQKPDRADFIDSAPSGHFLFHDIQSHDTGGDAPWAVFSIFERLEAWRTQYGMELPNITRGYSTPRHNAEIHPAGKKNSLHIYGKAVDVQSSMDKAFWEELSQAARDVGACIEPRDWGKSHVHADWRGGCPDGF
jgi:hypothetical protein